MIATIELFEALKTRFGEPEAKVIVQEIEKIETGIETKVDKRLEEKSNQFASKADIADVRQEIANAKVEILRWTFGFFIVVILAILGLYFKH